MAAFPPQYRYGFKPFRRDVKSGAVAQLGERLVRNEEVRGSNPLGSTRHLPDP